MKKVAKELSEMGICCKAEVKISEQGMGKDISLRIENIDLTQPCEWEALQKWLNELRSSLVAMCNAPDALPQYNNSICQIRRNWDIRHSKNLPPFEVPTS